MNARFKQAARRRRAVVALSLLAQVVASGAVAEPRALNVASIAPGVRASPFGQGPIVVVRRLRARETYGFTVEARPGEVLRISAVGDGDTNIDLVLRDEAGEVVCADDSLDHYPACTVSGPTGGPLRIEVINRGDVWSRVQILTN